MRTSEMKCDCEVVQEEVVDKVKARMPKLVMIAELTDFFKVLGDSTRMQIMWALDQSEMCTSDLAVLLDMTKSAVSHQLRILKDYDLVKVRKVGKNVFYAFADEHVKQVFETAVEHLEEKK